MLHTLNWLIFAWMEIKTTVKQSFQNEQKNSLFALVEQVSLFSLGNQPFPFNTHTKFETNTKLFFIYTNIWNSSANKNNLKTKWHCVKSVQIRSYFWSVLYSIRTEYWKMRTSNNSIFANISCSVKLRLYQAWLFFENINNET